MNFKINPIVLTQLITSLPDNDRLTISNLMFLNRLCVADVTVWDIDHVKNYMQSRINLAAAIIASDELCELPYFSSVMRSNVIIPNVPFIMQMPILGRLESFISQRKTTKIDAFYQLVHILEGVDTTVSILELLTKGLTAVDATTKAAGNTNTPYTPSMPHSPFQGMPPLGNTFWNNGCPPQIPMMYPAGWGGNASGFMPSQSGWTGPAHSRHSTPESFAASPDGQKYASQRAASQQLISQQNAWEDSLKSKTSDEYSESKPHLENLQLQALGRTIHDLTQAVQSLRAEISQQANTERARKREDAAKVKTSTSPEVPKTKHGDQASNYVAPPIMVKSKRTLIKKEPKA